MPQVDPSDPFASFDPFNAKQKANGSLAVSTAPDTTGKDPFANFDPFKGTTEESKSSTLGAATRGAIGGAAPGIGSLPAIGLGAEAGAVVGGLPGAIVGGIAGGYFGSQGIATAQNWLLNKVPKIRDLLGQGEEQKRRDEEEHPIASFLGGIAPFAITMSPMSAIAKNLPENATTWQRLSANPLTARLFSGGIMGGMQAGQEAISEDKVNWTRVAVATGFGLLFNKPNDLGHAVSEYGAKPARVLLGVPHPSRPPTLAEVSEQNVAGPGVTESTFMGSEQRNPAAEAAAQHTAGVEESIIGPVRSPDLENTARQTHPELFEEYDNLLGRRQTFKNWIDSQNEPKPHQFLDLEERRAALEKELAEHTAARGGYDRGPRARQIKAQIREIDTEHAALTERGAAFQAGTAVETPDIAIARKHLVDTDVALRDLQPRIQAAYRSAAEYTGAPTVPPPEVTAPPAETATAPPAGATVAEPAGAVTQRAAGLIDQQRAFIAKDFADKMKAAGRPAEEAELAGQLVAARYAARASRFGGSLGSAVDLYKAEAPKIIGGRVVTAPKTAEPTPELPANPTRQELNAYLAANANAAVAAAPKGEVGVAVPPPEVLEVPKPPPAAESSPAKLDEFRAEMARRAADRKQFEVNIEREFNATGRFVMPTTAPNKTWVLTKNIGDVPLRITFFDGKEPTGHIEVRDFEEAAKELIGWRPKIIEMKKRAPRGPAAKDPDKYSLFEFLAKGGGLQDTPDTRAIFSNKNPFVPGFGPLLRAGGKSIDRALESVIEGGYIARAQEGEPAPYPQVLRDLLDTEGRGAKQYKLGQAAPVKEIDLTEQRKHIDDAIDDEAERNGYKPSDVDKPMRDRMVELLERGETKDASVAWEQAFMETERNAAETGTIQTKSENIPGWDRPISNEPGAAPGAGAEAPPRDEQPHGTEIREQPRNVGGDNREQAKETDPLAHLSQQDIDDFFQAARGSIRFTDGVKPIITLLRDANASTIIHELGHGWVEELMRDSQHPSAPESIRNDAQTVLKWLGLKDAGDLTERTQKGNPTAAATKAHERFATGFEQYLREGKAPSAELADVFARFKNWLMEIYKTIKGLGKEISPDIRSVFDRMLTEEPQQTVIGPERPGGPTLAEVHEGDAKATEPHEGEPARDRVIAERDRYAEEQPPNIKAELEGAEKQASGEGAEPTGEGAARPSGPEQVVGGGGEPEPIAPGGGGGEEPGKIVKGGTNARPESPIIPGAGARAGSPTEREHPLATGPAPDQLPRGESKLVDKAGNIRVENVTNIEDVGKAIHESAERNSDFEDVRGAPMGKGLMWDLSTDLGRDPSEMDENALRSHLDFLVGGMKDMAKKVLAVRRFLKQSASMVADLAKKATQSNSDEDVAQFTLAVSRHDMIQSAVSGATASWGRTGTAFHDISEGWDTTKNVNALIMSKTGRTLFQMKQLAKLMSEYETTGQISKLVQDSGKKSFGRMATEYWINGLISGIQTHVTYSVGNTILAMEKMGPETLAAAGIGELRKMLGREGETVRLGEVIAGLKGVREGFWGAVQSGLMAARSGVTTLLPGEEASKTRRFQPPLSPGSNLVKEAVLNEAATFQDAVSTAYSIMRGTRDAILAGAALQRAGGVAGAPVFGWEYSPLGAIPNFQIRGVTTIPIGEIARAPSRMIAAIHSFFRPLNYSIDINQRAYRAAANENLTGTDFDAKVAALRQSPTAEMMEGAHNAATELTLMGAGGAFTKKLSGLVNTEFFGSKDSEGKHIPGSGLPILKFIDPFVHISSNIINQSIVQRTPFGILSAQVRADLLGRNGNIAADTAAARMLAGTALSLMFGGLAAEGYITGSEPKDRQEAAVWRQVYQAHSVKIGDVWYDMHRLGPMGMLLSTAADLYEVAHQADRGEFTKAAAHLQHAVTQNILDESFMRGPSDLIKAVEDPARYGEAYIKNFISSFIPFSVAMSQMARASDPYSRDARTVVDAIKSKVPGLSQTLMPRRDVWGEILPSRESLGPPGITAIWEQKTNEDPVNIALLNLGIHPAAVGRKIRNVELTEEQHDDWARLAGRLAKLRMNAIVQSSAFQNMPAPIKHDLVVEQLRQSREVARNMMFMKYPSLLVDAQAAKMQKRMGPQ